MHPVGLIADYLPEPPSDLPAGMVGTLVDESADMQDILASILDLARRGVLEIEEVQEPGFLGIGSKTDFIYRKKTAIRGRCGPTSRRCWIRCSRAAAKRSSCRI